MFTPFAFVKTTVTGGGGFDPDAQAFITATGISGTNATAINTLVLDLKAAGIWSLLDAAYPFVGGTAESCKYNLVNPTNSDAAYRLNFQGNWTFSDQYGARPNTNADSDFADTFWLPSSNPTHHIYRYINQINNVSCNYWGAGPSPYLIQGTCGNLEFFDSCAADSGGGSYAGANGFSQGNDRISSNSVKFYRAIPGTYSWSLYLNNTCTFTTLPSNTFTVGKVNGLNGFGESHRYGYASLGKTLGDSLMLAYDGIISTFCTTLGRNY